MDESTSSFVITRRDGSEHTVLVDAELYDTIRGHATWCLDARGYVHGRVLGTPPGTSYVKLHRYVMGFVRGDPDLDHRNGNRLDNRRGNLRPTTHADNCLNRAVVTGVGASPYRGVCLDRRSGRWSARQKIQGRIHYVGEFATDTEAATALARFRTTHDLPSY